MAHHIVDSLELKVKDKKRPEGIKRDESVEEDVEEAKEEVKYPVFA